MRGIIRLTIILLLAFAGAQNAFADQETREVQARLVELGYDVSVDGVFGRETENALRKFQKERGISPADGELNRRTREALFEAAEEGDEETVADGLRCRRRVTATGYRRIAEFRAKSSAERAWSNKVATLPRYGLAYSDLNLAKETKVVCIKACAECTVSKVCTITAVPCQQVIPN